MTERAMDDVRNQYRNPYRSTSMLCDYIDSFGLMEGTKAVLDIGSGAGQNMYYLSRRYQTLQCTGIDIDPAFVRFGNELLTSEFPQDRIDLVTANVFKIPGEWCGKFEGLTAW